MTIVNSEQKVKQEDPGASISTLGEESSLGGICNVETMALQTPISSTAAAQFSISEERTILQASISCTAAAQFSVSEENMTPFQASVSSTVAAQFPVSEPISSTAAAQFPVSETISSTAAAQLPVREEEMATLQASFPIWEDKEKTSDQFVSLWSEAIQRLGNICSMEFNAPSAPMCPTEETQLTGREERRRTSEQAVTLSEVVETCIGGLENLCLLENGQGEKTWRSPLPSWYPRRPLQDITAVLNIGPVPSEEASNLKKGSKKAQSVQLLGHLHDNRGGAFGQQRAPRAPCKPTSPVSAAPKRSSLLRKGFR